MYQSVILLLAKKDIGEAAYWYNSKQKGLGNRFIANLREKVNFILQNPAAAPVRYDEVRTAVLDDFPFMIHYTVNNSEKQVIIVAVLHTSLNPDRWKDRS